MEAIFRAGLSFLSRGLIPASVRASFVNREISSTFLGSDRNFVRFCRPFFSGMPSRISVYLASPVTLFRTGPDFIRRVAGPNNLLFIYSSSRFFLSFSSCHFCAAVMVSLSITSVLLKTYCFFINFWNSGLSLFNGKSLFAFISLASLSLS